MLVVEMWRKRRGKYLNYVHPHFDEITAWVHDNNYKEVARLHADSVFIRDDVPLS